MKSKTKTAEPIAEQKPKRKTKKLFENKEVTLEAPKPAGVKTVRNRTFKEYLLPAHLQGMDYRDTAVKAYIKELLLEFKTELEIATIVTEITGEKRARAHMLISAAKLEMEIEFSKKSKDAILGFLEAAIFKGMAVCYKEKDMAAYMRGCSLLKDIYGVEKKIRATFEPSNPHQVFGDTFITLKDRDRAKTIDAESFPIETMDGDSGDDN